VEINVQGFAEGVLIDQSEELGGIPDNENKNFYLVRQCFSWVSRSSRGKPKSELRLAPVELVRFARPVLMESSSKKFSFAPYFPEFQSTLFSHHPI
jgi:hypothetical protein